MNGSRNREAEAETRENMPDRSADELWRKWISNKMVRRTGIALFICVILAAVGPCTITHKFGPYYGKTVDAETGEPIEGAVVLAAFYTEVYTPAGTMSRFVDALEVMTDSRGEFHIPAYRAWVFRAPHRWDTSADFVIFKPGYGNFPGHKGVEPKFSPGDTLPPNEHVTMKLPRLRTPDELKENSRLLPPASVPPEKMKTLVEMIQSSRFVPRVHVLRGGVLPDSISPVLPGSP